MANLPSGPHTSVSFPVDAIWVPVATVNENIHILPGIARLFQKLVDGYFKRVLVPKYERNSSGDATLKEYGVVGEGGGFIRIQIGTQLRESQIADTLTTLQSQFAIHGIKIGSYPRLVGPTEELKEGEFRVCVSVVGSRRDLAVVNEVAEKVKVGVDGFDIQ
jgi:molybdopterin-biosynthesis enzyme MoeA-like protein